MMAGLLYKDFVGIKGKRIVWVFVLLTIAFLILRFIFPGNIDTDVSGILMENEVGDLVEMPAGALIDSFLVMLPMLLVVCGMFFPMMWTTAICRNDEKNKTRQFTRALPLEKNAFIASKYIFLGISVYVLFTIETIWIIIFNSMAGQNNSKELMTAFSQFLPVFNGICLIVAAIELAFFITLGVKKGTVIKTALMEILGFFVIAYLLFGDLNILEKWDIFVFINWCQENIVLVTMISIISPVINILFYLLSYRLTCRINKNKEAEVDG